MIGDARTQLREQTTLRRSAVDDLLAPAEELLVTDAWPVAEGGCGLFSAPGCSIRAHLDVRVPSMAVVADRFVTTPLVAAVPAADRFYVVAIDRNGVRLLRGERHGLIELTLPAVATRPLAATAGSGDGGLHSYRQVDRAVWQALVSETAPLIVAGVTEELDRYRTAHHYTHLAGTVALENTERLGLDELHDRLWPVAAHALDRPRRELVHRVRTSAALTSLPEILIAAREARLAALLVQPNRLLWGSPDTGEVHAERRPGDIELVTAAISAALEHFAMVFAVSPHELPADVPVTAILND
jgi:hypothetical protein